ncbi:MAG TPA: 50S ribosomal protein L21 [Candidatus Saccharimonadales bacterium]|jgi:large subunit ribosomal protein L21|nr:50S ribosomal protein L21 [Candidatus Saccharimonadales bacterium]
MYAVIRSGGKQYRVAPGEIVRIEKLPAGEGDRVEFKDVLAVSAEAGKIGPGADALVTGQVMKNARADKILVFHFKRKKQYKKIYGHRQPYTAVRITQIAFDGQKFDAPDLPQPKPKKARPEGETPKATGAAPKKKAAEKAPAKKVARKPVAKGKKK